MSGKFGASKEARMVANSVMRFARVMLCGGALVWTAGCAFQTDRDMTALDALMREQQLRNNSAETTVWVHNRTGVPIQEFGMKCKSVDRPDKRRSYATNWTRKATIEGEPLEVWSERYPEPLVLETLKVRFGDGGWHEYQLGHRCQPGDKITLVVETEERVLIRAKE
ncbi:hypothetical protein [Gemmata obscuriglobus]|nr:hypothetical protein [Gemmata obscuriglobus]